MSNLYVDTSALVKRYVNEPGSEWVRSITSSEAGNTIIISQITRIELYSALNGALRGNKIRRNTYQAYIDDITALLASEYEIINFQSSMVDIACRLLEQYKLRAYDSIQLASALEANSRLLSIRLPNLIFITGDLDLLEAAKSEGLTTDNPDLHP